ncbi:hypothetical protein BDQ94DRAFT_136997 [Aspergillus welwitschiae]|uniref:Uncharacterized protein n=1 Tax=Aspergillus welwitschiae TaxID=1341132 RepID=A0A3F3QDW3_9EURO|nr:hypothetical protein BDQ94DRAFT_136997 [Aspergillus welwitschiae]RDH36866.1 hypothetical protein BDQ94DRAFT_136997 [Aspergillus welwitschiae]
MNPYHQASLRREQNKNNVSWTVGNYQPIISTSSVITRVPYCIRVPFPPSSTTREGDVVKSRHLQTLPHPRRPTSSPTANHGSTQSRTDSSTSIPPKQAISSNPRRSLHARELPLTEELPARPAPSKANIRGDEQR